MDSQLDYNTLLERYLDLQKRVTKFSSVEQDLINTRDRLDHELISYKRLHTFSERALREMPATGFNTLVTESIVDIFEVECSLLHFRNKTDNSSMFESEGLNTTMAESDEFKVAVKKLEKKIGKDQVALLDFNDFKDEPQMVTFSRAMAARFSDPISGCSLFIMGIVRREVDSLYPTFNSKNQTIFGIFLKQLQSFFANRIRTEELRKTNSELDSFVYSVSHDLRAPLLSLQGIIELIQDSEGLTDEVKDYLSLAHVSIHRLDNNIREILEYSRNARLKITPEKFNIREMVDDIIASLRYLTDEEIDYFTEIEGSDFIITDKARVKVLLNNIIANSVKYRRRDGIKPFIKFSLKRINQYYDISVEDNGEGIPDGSKEKVFDMFYRASTSTAGTGLGLYICKEIITKLNGKISLHSELGKGTTINFMIPEKKISTNS